MRISYGSSDVCSSVLLRGPFVATLHNPGGKKAVGTHSGAYSLYRALAIAAGQLKAEHKPDLTNTAPAERIGPFPQWADPEKIVSMDPWGHMTSEVFAQQKIGRAHV